VRRIRFAVAGLALLLTTGCESRSQEVADGWREMLRGVLPSDATDFGVLANHYDDGVAIFRYYLPAQDPSAVLTGIDQRFAEKFLGYVVTTRTADMIRLRCEEHAARHWHAAQYEFHVCNRGGTLVVGLRIGNDMTDGLRRAYEAEALERARQECGLGERRRTRG
jgi:hypothetical protein